MPESAAMLNIHNGASHTDLMRRAAAALAACVAAAAAAASAPAPYDAALVTVGEGALTAPAQPDFIGFSLEWKDHIHLLGNGSDAAGVKLSYMRLLRNIQELNGGAGAAGPRLRLGGNSATSCFYNPNGTLPAPSPAEKCFIQPTDLSTVFQFIRYSHGPDVGPNTSVTFGVNFFDGHNASLGVAEAAAIDAARARFDRNGSLTRGMSYGFEIGVSRAGRSRGAGALARALTSRAIPRAPPIYPRPPERGRRVRLHGHAFRGQLDAGRLLGAVGRVRAQHFVRAQAE